MELLDSNFPLPPIPIILGTSFYVLRILLIFSRKRKSRIGSWMDRIDSWIDRGAFIKIQFGSQRDHEQKSIQPENDQASAEN